MFVAAILALQAVFWADITTAQTVPATPGASTKNPEQDALFKRILKEPANLDVAYRHAEVANAGGDYEAAIGSLERLLFFNPNLPRVMLELGVLDFRLGSYEMAREYLTKSVAAPDTPPEVRTQVDAYLAEIAKRLNPSQTTAFGQVGVRYQTNANAGPAGGLVRVFGFDATLDSQFVKARDWNAFAQGTVRNVVDLGNQRGDTWESQIATYLTRQHSFTRLDTALLDVQTGPRFALFPEQLKNWSIRPYVGATGIRLGGNNYLSAQTAGSSIAWTPTPGWNYEAGVERSRRDFRTSEDYPTVDIQSGFQNTGYLNLSGLLFAGWTWTARAAISRNDAQVDYQSYQQAGIDFNLSYAMTVPLFGADRRITFIPFAGLTDTRYDGADFFVDPDTIRRDRERRLGVALDVQLTPQFGVGIRLQQSKITSNIPNYATDNLSVFAGPTFKY